MTQSSLEEQKKIEDQRKAEEPEVDDPIIDRFRVIKRAIGYRPAVHFPKPGLR